MEAGIPGLRDTSVLVIGETCTDVVCSFLPQHGQEGPILASEYGTYTYHVIERPERLKYGLRSRIGLTTLDFRDPGAYLRRYTTD